MSTYAIGDVQGCYEQLQALLKHINYNPSQDKLWFCGDLVNRGPHSLATLRFIKSLPRATVILGNHDLHLLALAYTSTTSTNSSLKDILHAPDREELLTWLRHKPLLHYDAALNYVLVHAGIPPQWTLSQAQDYANEVENTLRSSNYLTFLQHMYGNEPAQWQEQLSAHERLRCIVNYLTRMRFCDNAGRLDLTSKGAIGSQPVGYQPWFAWPAVQPRSTRIVFGHWAALKGKTDNPNAIAIDTGCVWGGSLTALRLEDQQHFYVNCPNPTLSNL